MGFDLLMITENLQIFVLNGPPRSGKNTFGDLVREHLPEGSFIHTSSIDPIKTILQKEALWEKGGIPSELWDVFRKLKNQLTEKDWDGVLKDSFWRETMSKLKALIMEENPDFLDGWVVSECLKAGASIAFVDIREPEAIDRFIGYCTRSYPGIKTGTILVVSDMAETHENSSDQRVLDHPYDFTIKNYRLSFGEDVESSMQALRSEAERFLLWAKPDLTEFVTTPEIK